MGAAASHSFSGHEGPGWWVAAAQVPRVARAAPHQQVVLGSGQHLLLLVLLLPWAIRHQACPHLPAAPKRVPGPSPSKLLPGHPRATFQGPRGSGAAQAQLRLPSPPPTRSPTERSAPQDFPGAWKEPGGGLDRDLLPGKERGSCQEPCALAQSDFQVVLSLPWPPRCGFRDASPLSPSPAGRAGVLGEEGQQGPQCFPAARGGLAGKDMCPGVFTVGRLLITN